SIDLTQLAHCHVPHRRQGLFGVARLRVVDDQFPAVLATHLAPFVDQGAADPGGAGVHHAHHVRRPVIGRRLPATRRLQRSLAVRHPLTAPKLMPVTSCFWERKSTMATGSTANVPAAIIGPTATDWNW